MCACVWGGWKAEGGTDTTGEARSGGEGTRTRKRTGTDTKEEKKKRRRKRTGEQLEAQRAAFFSLFVCLFGWNTQLCAFTLGCGECARRQRETELSTHTHAGSVREVGKERQAGGHAGGHKHRRGSRKRGKARLCSRAISTCCEGEGEREGEGEELKQNT